MKVDFFDGAYSNFTEQVLESIREATFGEDIGQNSWVTADEYEVFIENLRLNAHSHVLEVASGSGGPALHLARRTGCRVTGVDVNSAGVATANAIATRAGVAERLRFMTADATRPLPFEDNTFDAMLCIDSMNHFPNRGDSLKEWCRILRPRRWREARQRFRDDLLRMEGAENFEGVQKFLGAVHQLTAERRLSRIAYVAEK